MILCRLILAFLIASWASASAEEAVKAGESYILRPNDTVSLSVYLEPELSKDVSILKTGNASFELIGSVKVGGLSLDDAAEKLKTRYAEYIRNPELTLTVSEYATEFVEVIGQVNKPKQVPLPQIGKLDVGGALASAGGITDSADPENIKLVTTDGRTKILTLSAIQGDADRIILKSGDRLIVHKSPFANSEIQVIGEVKNPGAVSLSKSGKLDLASALATAGGLGPEADLSRIRVISASNQTHGTYTYKAIQTGDAGRFTLRDGDQVIVGKSAFVDTTVTILGQVKTPGAIAFPLDGRLDIMTAIAMAGGYTELANPKKVSITRAGKKGVYDLNKAAEQGKGGFFLFPNDIVSVAERLF